MQNIIQQNNDRTNIIVVYLGISLCSIIANFIAFLFQFLLNELPCPLCLLQRFGLLAVNIGTLLNIKHGKSLQYDIMIVTAILVTMIVAVRQMMLHIIPNDPGYGSAFFGIHIYTWSFILSFIIIVSMAIAPLFDYMIPVRIHEMILTHKIQVWKVLSVIVLILTFANLISTYFICGFSMCPSDPTSYSRGLE